VYDAVIVYMYVVLKHVALEESRDQFINPGQIFGYIGEGKGIQGHQNSSYLDSTIFALFAVSDVFDSMFLEQRQGDPVGDVKNILWKRIVNPLRRFVLHRCKILDDKLLMGLL
jgi:ubiquitin thioesterase CYLD